MPEPTATPTPNGAGDNSGTPTTNANGNEPGKNGNEGGTQGIPDFDPSKLSDEQLNKVLEDQRLWKTQRLSELREQAKKGKEYEAQKAKQAEEEAKKRGDFDKVLADKDAQIQKLTEQLNNGQLDNNLRDALSKAGVKNLNAGLKLIDRANLKIGDDGKIEGLDEAVNSFKSQYPELINSSTTPTPDVGSGTNPAGDGRVPGTFKMSEIQNTEFYQKHEAEIQKALLSGRIIDDRK